MNNRTLHDIACELETIETTMHLMANGIARIRTLIDRKDETEWKRGDDDSTAPTRTATDGKDAPGATGIDAGDAPIVDSVASETAGQGTDAGEEIEDRITKAYQGRVWIALGYPEGREGWIEYCRDHFTAETAGIGVKPRTDPIMNSEPTVQISDVRKEDGCRVCARIHELVEQRRMCEKETSDGMRRRSAPGHEPGIKGWKRYCEDAWGHPRLELAPAPERKLIESPETASIVDDDRETDDKGRATGIMSVFFAEHITDGIRRQFGHVLIDMLDLRENIAAAYRGRAWIALGYEPGIKGWKRYCEENFRPASMRLTQHEKKELTFGFNQGEQLSNAALAAVFGVDQSTIYRWRKGAGQRDAVQRVQGADGRRYHIRSRRTKEQREQWDEYILELSERGMREIDIAGSLGISQPSVNEAKQRARRRRDKER